MMPSSAVDNLLAFAYSIPGVVNVSLEIDQENKLVKYDVKIKNPRLYKFINHLSAGGIFKKILALILIGMGAPRPNIYKDYIRYNTSAYLPASFGVEIHVGK